MKLAVKNFGMGNKRIINITQHKERKLSLLLEMEARKSRYVYIIKAKEST